MSLGLGMPNCGGRPYTDEEMQAVKNLKPANILVIAYPGDGTEPERISQVKELCDYLGIYDPNIRVYIPNAMSRSPQDVGFEVYLTIQPYKAKGLKPKVFWTNENNLPGERGLPEEAGWQEDWDFQAQWLEASAADFRMRSPNTIIITPALSPNGRYLDGLAHYMAMKGFDKLGIHVYSLLQLQDVVAVQNLGAQVVITEHNQLPMAELAKLGVPNFYFILDSPDSNFNQYSLLKNPQLFDEFKRVNDSIIPIKEEPMPDTTNPQFVVGSGIMDAMIRNNDVPAEDEWPLAQGRLEVCAGYKAFYTYSFASNEVYISPKA